MGHPRRRERSTQPAQALAACRAARARPQPPPSAAPQGDALGRGQLFLHPSWLQLATADGQLLYLHRLRPHLASPNFYPAPVGGTCGGFLVDEMVRALLNSVA